MEFVEQKLDPLVQAGAKPDDITLNIPINDRSAAWTDDALLLSRPLNDSPHPPLNLTNQSNQPNQLNDSIQLTQTKPVPVDSINRIDLFD